MMFLAMNCEGFWEGMCVTSNPLSIFLLVKLTVQFIISHLLVLTVFHTCQSMKVPQPHSKPGVGCHLTQLTTSVFVA